jgi:hypothetical protein
MTLYSRREDGPEQPSLLALGGKVESATAGSGAWSDVYAGSVSMPASAKSLNPPTLNTAV